MRRTLLVLAALAVCASPARADYYGQGATVVSASSARAELADDRSVSSDVARDGRWVVFDTRATNFFADDDPDPRVGDADTDRLGGIFRRDLDTGALALVADGDLVDEDDGGLLVRGARNPSVSADGRYVAFSTAQALVPADTDVPRRHIDVYVRDMSVPVCRPLPACAPNPYTLVSARDGTDVPLVHAAPSEEQPAGASGTEVTAGTSLSSDGRRVAFTTGELASDAGPPRQLLVRDLATKATTLITRRSADGTPAGGATGAVLSGDGSTVAWVGTNAAEQTRFQPGEAVDFRLEYFLWRRVGGSVTRRITGMVDPDDPGCSAGTPVDASDQASGGPCYGPLASWDQERGAISSFPPSLSEDGFDVAFVTASGPRPGPTLSGGYDLFTTSMRPGLSRKAATRELTRDAQGDVSGAAGIDAAALSPDGRYIVVATARIRFLLPALRLLGATRPTATGRDLYLVDRTEGTIERILTAVDGGDPNGDVDARPSVSAGASLVAFTAAASNLFRGDANDRPDAFVVRRQPRPVESEPPPEPPPPPDVEAVGEVLADPPVLFARSIRGKRTGVMVVEALPPGAGRLETILTARLPDREGKLKATTPIQRLARAAGTAGGAQRVKMTVKLGKRPLALLKRLRRLTTSALVRWTPANPGQGPLQTTVTVRFALVKKKAKKPVRKPVKRKRVNSR